MSQHDMNIANQGFPGFRSDLNNALEALVTLSSGATAPSTTFAYQIWVDTGVTPALLKIRDGSNTAWITLGSIDSSADTFTSAVERIRAGNGTSAAPAFSFTGDNDTGFYSAGTNEIGVAVNGTAAGKFTSTGFNGNAANVSGIVAIANGGTGQTTASAAFDALKQSATTTYVGAVELATDTEVKTGTDTTRAMTPDAFRKQALVQDTVQASTSGTSIEFTGIPSWVKRISILLAGVSTNGTTRLLVQVGLSTGYVTTGYISGASYSSTTSSQFTSDTTGFVIEPTGVSVASWARHGRVVLEKQSVGTWVSTSAIYSEGGTVVSSGGGSIVSLGGSPPSGPLDRVRLTTVGNVDTFDAGTVNIIYE